jgi:hypothetical protein
MKQIITNKRVCFYDVLEEKVVAMMSDLYNPDLDDYTILTLSFNPQLMDWVDLPIHPEVWMKNSNIRVEVMCEYAEVEQWFDKLKRVIFG